MDAAAWEDWEGGGSPVLSPRPAPSRSFAPAAASSRSSAGAAPSLIPLTAVRPERYRCLFAPVQTFNAMQVGGREH